MPVNVGHVSQLSNLKDIWNSDLAKELQEDISSKKFSHCAVDRCGVMDHDILFDRYELGINIDHSCNLSCPSCRSEHIMISDGEEYTKRLNWVNHTVELLEDFSDPIRIIMSGNGDPLASHIMRPLIANFTPKSNHQFRLFTNGLLIKKQLEKSRILPNITQIFISIDAGSKEVYENVRRPGKWKTLIENLDFLQEIAKEKNILVQLNFVLQNENYFDLPNFVSLCKKYNFNGSIAKLEDWGTWTNFVSQDVVGNILHQNHQKALNVLKTVYKEIANSAQFDFSPQFHALCV